MFSDSRLVSSDMDHVPYIRDFPEAAQAIGFLTIGIANLEARLYAPLATILGSVEAASAVLQNIDSISAKVAVTCDLAKLVPANAAAAALLKHAGAIRAAIAERNRLCHGLYGIDEDTHDLLLMSGYITNRRGAHKSSVLDVAAVMAHVEAINLADMEIQNAVGDMHLTKAHGHIRTLQPVVGGNGA